MIILATILAAFDFMDFVAENSEVKALKTKEFFGAPGTIRTCDRLVRSQCNIPIFSSTCAILFWPQCPGSLRTISNLARFFGRPTNWLKASIPTPPQPAPLLAFGVSAFPTTLPQIFAKPGRYQWLAVGRESQWGAMTHPTHQEAG